MIYDSIPKASSVFMASSNPKDHFAKMKRANRSAKMKQCKLDARREQWLSQVKNKGGSCKEEVTDGGISQEGPTCLENKRDFPIQKLEIKVGVVEIFGDGLPIHHYSDSESSLSNSPISHSSSILSRNDSGVNFTASSRSSSSSSSHGCFSGIMSEEDEEGCLDDWEAMADALASTSDKQQEHTPDSVLGSPLSEKHGNNISKAKQESREEDVQRSPSHCQAWMPDDASRPQSLPDLSKQYSFQFDSDCGFGRGGSVWGFKNVGPVPTCPICCEDLDCTDSSFLPCLCGFRLCLFCHKRILEGDGRCPGCRKEY